MSEENRMLTREEWISKIRKEGKHEAIRDEMIRLGFWEQPTLSEAEKQQQTEEDEEYKLIKQELQGLQKEAKALENVDKLLKEARRKRIEASRQRRAERKAKRKKAKLVAKKSWESYKANHVVYAGENVSAGLASLETDNKKLTDLNLPLIETAMQLAENLEISLSQLKWLTYHRNTATINHYRYFTIPKKAGGNREISAPKAKLKRVQSWINHHILTNLPVSPAAYGFISGKSIVDNAKIHVGQAVVIKLDLKDFFPSISFPRVKGLFQSFGYSAAVSTLLALICTEPPRKEVEFAKKTYYVAMAERQLPQGASTSPAITNLLCRRLDERLIQIAKTKGFRYSRYADDLTFSGGEEALHQIGSLINQVRNIVQYEGFTINEEKTRIKRSARRQRVTGIVVNQKPNLSRKELRAFRALLHNVEQRGIEAENRAKHANFWEYINGYLSYICMVRPDLGAKFALQVKRIKEKYV